MSASVKTRRRLKKCLTSEPFALLLRAVSPILRRIIPQKHLSRIPVVGAVKISYLNWLPVTMINNGNDSIATRIYWGGGGAFDQDSINLFLELARSAKVIFDIGANTGIYSLLAAVNNSTSEIHAFEPVPEILALFRQNVSANRFTNVRVNDIALSDQGGTAKFFVPTDFAAFPTSASLNAAFQEQTRVIEVKTMTLDEYISCNEIATVDLMKLDTESTEYLVFAGARKLLTVHRPFIICEVLPKQDCQLLTGLLTPIDYVYFWITPEGLYQKKMPEGDPEYKNLNYLMVPTEKVSLVRALSLRIFSLDS